MQSVKKRMQTLLAEIETEYDFGQFTMEGFVQWVEKRRNRQIIFVPWEMPSTIFGAWIKGPKDDYVFFEKDTLIIHQAHIQLHELSHVICDHPVQKVGPQQIHTLLRGVGDMDIASLVPMLRRSAYTDKHEQEAESLTELIQELVQRHAKAKELHKAIATEGDFTTYFSAYIKGLATG